MKQHHLFWYLLLAGFVLAVYAQTILPGLASWGDSAKFQFIGKVLGTPHQPGYPLYVLINYLFIHVVPIGSIALRVNLLSAVFALAALLVFLNLLLVLKLRPWVAFITALSFAFMYSTWLYAIIPEVYSLNLLFLVVVINLLIRWGQTRGERYFYLACLVYGLSFGNHQVMIALLPSFIFWVWVTDRRSFLEPRKILWVIGCVLLGLATYLYIPWRTNDPATAYLELNTQAWLDYLRHPGTGIAFRLGLADILRQRLPVAAGIVWKNISWLLLPAIFGIFVTKNRRLNIFLLLLLVTDLLVVMQLDIPEADGMYLPAFLVMAIFLGFALEWLAGQLGKNPRLAWGLAIVPIFFLWLNYARIDQSEHSLHDQRTKLILRAAGRDALIIADDYENAEYLWYYLLGENLQRRNLFALPDYSITAEQVRQYLAGESTPYLKLQRRDLPPGLRVYVMASAADEFMDDELVLRKSGSKYLLEVILP